MDGSTRGSQYSDVLKNYNLGGELGIGTFGKVKIAEHKHTGQKVAIKILNRSQMKNMGMEDKGMPPYTNRPHYFLFCNPLLTQDFKVHTCEPTCSTFSPNPFVNLNSISSRVHSVLVKKGVHLLLLL
jgi:serine/threonine protein kinase